MHLPPDVAAYLVLSAKEIAAEQGFVPASQAELKVWLEKNTRAVGERAKAKMEALRDQLLSEPKVFDAVCAEIGAAVYLKLRAAPA